MSCWLMATSRRPEERVLLCQLLWIVDILVANIFRSTPTSASSNSNSPSLLKLPEHAAPRGRSRSRGPEPRRRPPPRPTVEDEAVSLKREHRPSVSSDEPPLRGIIEQNPIILEADVTAAEAARLHAQPHHHDDDNSERRFVLLPKSDTYSPTTEEEHIPKGWAKPKAEPPKAEPPKAEPPRESLPRRRSRQDLPALQTKVPLGAPPPFRRSASAQGSIPGDKDATPRPTSYSRSQSELLSPDVSRFPKEYFSAAPRHHSESVGARSTSSTKRNSGPTSRPGTPSQEKRNSGNFDGTRSRRGTNEKLPRPQQLYNDEPEHRRHASTHSRNLAPETKSSGRSSPHSRRHDSSDSDIADSDSDSPRHKHRHRHRHHRHKELQENDDYHRRSPRSSGELKGRKYSTPLPSPKVSPSQLPPHKDRERAETFPQRSGSRSPIDRSVSPFSPSLDPRTSGDRLNPMDSPVTRPRSRQANPIPIPVANVHPTPPPPSLPIMPSRVEVHNPDPRRAPSVPHFDGHRPSSARPPPPAQAPYWQPPPFAPGNLDKPVGSVRRYSEELEKGDIAPLPTCPRTTFTRGRNDWLTLPQCPSFDICPSCFESTIAPTEFRRFFVKAPPRPPEAEVVCDFGSSPWYRIAWLLTRKEHRHDLKLFYGLANIAATSPACLGKHEAVRQWHFLIDPKTRQPIHNFNVCSSCVKSIEILLPALRGVFVRDPNRPMGPARICDFRFDSKRFIQYFDILETTADRADDEDAPPDTRALVSLAKRFSQLPECQKDKDLIDKPWNVITQLPEFTVCEECFDEVVWPELDDGKAIPKMFHEKLQRVPKASCQLYSAKMRGIFRTAVDSDDYRLLASKARERKTVEQAYKSNLEGLRRQGKTMNPNVVGMEIKRVEDEWRRWE
jgi:hypothetical protein